MWKNTSADRVRQVRQFHGLSQRELAKKLGVSRRSVIRFEQRGAYLSDSTYEWNGGAYKRAPSIWSLLAEAYDATDQAPIAGEDLQKLSPARRRRRARPVTRAKRRRISRKVSPRRRSDTSRSRRVTRRRRRRGRGRR